jgi:hypothetical protein
MGVSLAEPQVPEAVGPGVLVPVGVGAGVPAPVGVGVGVSVLVPVGAGVGDPVLQKIQWLLYCTDTQPRESRD